MMDLKYAEYLSNLSEVEKKNAPEILFWEGDFSLLTTGLRVAVVGSRKASAEGIRRARILTEALVRRNITVVSGLAEGIDTIAHQTAIQNEGRTIAVLGTPLSRAFPASNAALLQTIKDHHLAISQFPENYPSHPRNFPMRNRTMALISDATIIIEAGEQSGTRHQGWEALRLGRLVYLMQNVAENPALTWPKEMIQYGAQVLTREGLSDALEDIPNFTAPVDCVF